MVRAAIRAHVILAGGSAWLTAMSYQAGLPPFLAPQNRISRFIMLSMITGKFRLFHERVQPTTELKRLASDVAPWRMIAGYDGFPVSRWPLPKLQKILKPTSCDPVSVFSPSISAVQSFPSSQSLAGVRSYEPQAVGEETAGPVAESSRRQLPSASVLREVVGIADVGHGRREPLRGARGVVRERIEVLRPRRCGPR
jgi:hypothetical protein